MSGQTTESVSDPSSGDYDPRSPLYDVTADPSSKYYVGPLATGGRSGDDLRNEAASQVDDEIAQGWLGPVVDPAVKDHRVQERYEQHLDEARQGLDKGLSIRQTGGAPQTMWDNATHEQMNAAITQNANSATVAETSEEWVKIGNELATHQENLAGAISASTANWQGTAGDAVREHLAGVGRWLGATAQGATLTGRQQQIHSQTLNETQKLMAANPPVAFSVQDANARLQQVTDPVQYAAQASQDVETYRAQQAARQHAAQIMTQFDSTIGGAIATPQFPAPPKLPGQGGASGGGASTAAQPLMARTPGTAADPAMAGRPVAADPMTARVPALDAGGGPGGSGVPGGGPGIPDGAGVPGGPSGSGGSGGSGVTGGSGGSGFTPPPLDLPDGSSGGGSGLGGGGFSGAGVPGVSVPNFDDTTKSSGFAPPSPPAGMPAMPGVDVPDLPGGNTVRSGGGPVTGGGFTPPPFDPSTGLTGGGLGPGGTGPGGSGAKMPTIGRGGGINGDSIASRLGGLGGGGGGGGSLGGGVGGGGGGTGIRTGTTGSLPGGAASSAAEAEQVAARNAAAAGAAGATKGAPGTPGMGGMGAAGGRGGKGEEDKEHKSADFVESDDPNFFAPDEVVAPPVIGDWKNQDWK